ncbi:MAG TPA: zf-HC2 domain-containing protein [Candidatus Limnocylindrales bacterium]|nr:zf-HC2 domain-containing protein [Candidatus Limnocylindrales bacterium]
MKENLSCDACERELIALIDGTLTPSVSNVVESHAESCERCGTSLAVHRALALRLRGMPLMRAPASLEDRVVREVMGARGFLVAGWQRFGAAVGALSFVLTVALLANLTRIADALRIPDPFVWVVSAIDNSISALTAASKWLGNEIAFYEPLARQLWLAMQALKTLPRAAIVSLRTPEVQVAGAIFITLGLALYILLRPSRRHEGSVGHVCLSL